MCHVTETVRHENFRTELNATLLETDLGFTCTAPLKNSGRRRSGLFLTPQALKDSGSEHFTWAPSCADSKIGMIAALRLWTDKLLLKSVGARRFRSVSLTLTDAKIDESWWAFASRNEFGLQQMFFEFAFDLWVVRAFMQHPVKWVRLAFDISLSGFVAE